MTRIGLCILSVFILFTGISCTKVDTVEPTVDETPPAVEEIAPAAKPHPHKHKVEAKPKPSTKDKAITPGGEDWKKWEKVGEEAGEKRENKLYKEPFGAQPSPGGAKIEELEDFENSPDDTRE